MSVKVTIRFHKDQLIAGMRRSAAYALTEGAISMQATMKGATDGPPWSAAGGTPGRLFGTLHRSIAVERAVPERLVARAGSGQKHGRYMQFGVRKSSKWLTVPLSKEAARMLAGAKSVRNIHELKWRPSNRHGTGGLLGLASRAKKTKGDFRPLFLLKAEVKARPWATIALARGAGAARSTIHSSFRAAHSREVASLIRGSRV